jgi:hypothetical protein
MESIATMKRENTLLFTKMGRNQYGLAFSLENNNLYLPAIVNLDFIKVIYSLSPEIFSSIHLEKINDNEGVLLILVKPLFEDFGIVQRFMYLHVKCIQSGNTIIIESQTIRDVRPTGVPTDAELINIDSFTNDFTFHSPHKMDIVNRIILGTDVVIPPFIDKIVQSLVTKIFRRVKQFVETAKS